MLSPVPVSIRKQELNCQTENFAHKCNSWLNKTLSLQRSALEYTAASNF